MINQGYTQDTITRAVCFLKKDSLNGFWIELRYLLLLPEDQARQDDQDLHYHLLVQAIQQHHDHQEHPIKTPENRLASKCLRIKCIKLPVVILMLVTSGVKNVCVIFTHLSTWKTILTRESTVTWSSLVRRNRGILHY